MVSINDDSEAKLCEFATDDNKKISVAIHKANLITTFENDFIGYIATMLDITYDLSIIHPGFSKSCQVMLVNKDTIDFVCKDDLVEHKIRIKHPWEPQKGYFTKYSFGRQVGSMHRKKQDLNVIKEALANACYLKLKNSYGNIFMESPNIEMPVT